MCTVCHEQLPLSCFWCNCNLPGGRDSQCSNCRSAGRTAGDLVRIRLHANLKAALKKGGAAAAAAASADAAGSNFARQVGWGYGKFVAHMEPLLQGLRKSDGAQMTMDDWR